MEVVLKVISVFIFEAFVVFAEVDEEGEWQLNSCGTTLGKAFIQKFGTDASFQRFLGKAEELIDFEDFTVDDVVGMNQDQLKESLTQVTQRKLAEYAKENRLNAPSTIPWKFVSNNHYFKMGGERYMMSPVPNDYRKRFDWSDEERRIFLLSEVTFYRVGEGYEEPKNMGGFLWNPR